MRRPAQQPTYQASGVGPSPTGEGLVGSLAGSIHISCSASCALQVGLPSAGVDDWQGLALLSVLELVIDEDLGAEEQARSQDIFLAHSSWADGWQPNASMLRAACLQQNA